EPLQFRDLSNTSFACVVPYADRNVVSYMGTKTEFSIDNWDQIQESLDDWKENGKAMPTAFRLEAEHLGGSAAMTLPGQVHRGFLAQLKAVQADVIRALLENGGRQRPVLITGHSQGGAEAALATAAIAAAGFPVEVTYTFAAPRAGMADFVSSISTPVFRFEFGDDIVPHMPPALIRHALADALQGQIQGFSFLIRSVANAGLQLLLAELTNVVYFGLGTLCYGRPEEQKLQICRTAAEETALFQSRLQRLKEHPKSWGDHHHLAGTDADVAANRRGTYTALVSDYAVST
ncbi:MAG: hypothetical protein KDA96_27735, partial [Planctomycetaceae bacterium]|nr:hypothetical protein [Planctomycetaceae bacterium]